MFPLCKMGWSTTATNVMAFFFSGLFHDYMLWTTFRIDSYWFTIGMVFQYVMIRGEQKLYKYLGIKEFKFGNIVIWFFTSASSTLLYLRLYRKVDSKDFLFN